MSGQKNVQFVRFFVKLLIFFTAPREHSISPKLRIPINA